MSISLSSCSNRSKKEFNKMLIECADQDQKIDASDWTKLKQFIINNKNNLSEFYNGDDINVEKVKDYIKKFFEGRRPPKEVSIYGISGVDAYLTIKFYLERSGSTYGYDTPQTRGDFKGSIVQLLNSLPGNKSKNADFIVNDGIYKYPKSYEEFISDPNIFETTKGIGDPHYTDFCKILTTLLKETKDNEISILVSDFIYSTKETQVVSAQKVFSEETAMCNTVFVPHVKDKSVVVLQIMGSYYGEYYPYDGSKGFAYGGQRPYYFIIIGNRSDIQRLTTDNQYAKFANFYSLHGFQHSLLFAQSNFYEPYYTISLGNPQSIGSFRVDRSNRSEKGVVHSIDDISPDRNSGKVQFIVAVNLKDVLADEEYKTDKNNFKVESDDPFVISQIRKINPSDILPSNKESLAKATHFIILTTNKFTHTQTLHIKLINSLPSWVEKSSSEDDRNVKSSNFSSTTFGLKYIINGIYNAYRSQNDEMPYYFDLKIDLAK